MAIHSSILAWRIPWMEEPGGLQFMGSQRVGHDWATNTAATLLPVVAVKINWTNFQISTHKCSKMGCASVFKHFFFGKDFCSLTSSWSYYHFLSEDLNFLSVNLPTVLSFPWSHLASPVGKTLLYFSRGDGWLSNMACIMFLKIIGILKFMISNLLSSI